MLKNKQLFNHTGNFLKNSMKVSYIINGQRPISQKQSEIGALITIFLFYCVKTMFIFILIYTPHVDKIPLYSIKSSYSLYAITKTTFVQGLFLFL